MVKVCNLLELGFLFKFCTRVVVVFFLYNSGYGCSALSMTFVSFSWTLKGNFGYSIYDATDYLPELWSPSPTFFQCLTDCMQTLSINTPFGAIYARGTSVCYGTLVWQIDSSSNSRLSSFQFKSWFIQLRSRMGTLS